MKIFFRLLFYGHYFSSMRFCDPERLEFTPKYSYFHRHRFRCPFKVRSLSSKKHTLLACALNFSTYFPFDALISSSLITWIAVFLKSSLLYFNCSLAIWMTWGGACRIRKLQFWKTLDLLHIEFLVNCHL